MTRERWEQILFAHVEDEVVQDMLNQYVLELESSNAKLREVCAELLKMAERHNPEWLHWPEMHEELRELGVEVDG